MIYKWFIQVWRAIYTLISALLSVFLPHVDPVGDPESGKSDKALHQRLDALRHVGDNDADELASIVGKSARDLLRLPVREWHKVPATQATERGRDVCSRLQALVTKTDDSRMPFPIDRAKLHRAQDLFRTHSPMIGLVLLCASLVGSYTAQHGVKVLVRTGRLSGGKRAIYRRLIETTSFYYEVMEHGLADPTDDKGRDACLRIRLVHAFVRQGCLSGRDSQWEQDIRGLPVNQEDLAGTLIVFSYVVVAALPRLGIVLSPEDREAFIHYWQYTGHLLGVESSILRDHFSSFSGAEKLYATIEYRQCRPDDDSRLLVSRLLHAFASRPDTTHAFKVWLPLGLLHQTSRTLIGTELANALQVHSSITWRIGLAMLACANWALCLGMTGSKTLHMWKRAHNRRAVTYVIKAELGQKRFDWGTHEDDITPRAVGR